MTLFLVVLADINKQIQRPVKMIGYADDWIICTCDQNNMATAQNNIQNALNKVSTWTRRKGFKISTRKNICYAYICRKRIRNHPEPVLNLKGQRLKMSYTHTKYLD
jgi:hypothetical protein